MKILLHGDFYRFIFKSENEIKILINNRTTEANIKIIIAALIGLCLKKLR